MGDPYPQARFGVMSNGDVLKVVTAGCSGERLTSIELRRLAESGSNPTSIELWSVEGNAPMPADIVLGDAPGGMVETVSLAKQLGPDDRLSLLVTTDQLQQASLEFSVAEIPAAGVLGDGVTFASSEVMRAEALDKKLCTDPNGDHDKQRILHWYFVITGSISAFGAAILVATWRRKPA